MERRFLCVRQFTINRAARRPMLYPLTNYFNPAHKDLTIRTNCCYICLFHKLQLYTVRDWNRLPSDWNNHYHYMLFHAEDWICGYTCIDLCTEINVVGSSHPTMSGAYNMQVPPSLTCTCLRYYGNAMHHVYTTILLQNQTWFNKKRFACFRCAVLRTY